MLKKILVSGVCLGLLLGPVCTEARSYPAERNERYYRNSRERILVKVADRVIDKVFDHYDEDGKEKSFKATVRNNMSVYADYPFMKPQTVAVTEEIPEGYRRDSYTGILDVGSLLAKKMSEIGMKSFVKAPADKTVKSPVELRYSVDNYNTRHVSLTIVARDTSTEQDIMEYNGYVSSSDMDDGQMAKALQAIVADFKDSYMTL